MEDLVTKMTQGELFRISLLQSIVRSRELCKLREKKDRHPEPFPNDIRLFLRAYFHGTDK